jgi:hypothetical protein
MTKPLHPHASFLGLPAELRLQIYAALASTLHIHVVYPTVDIHNPNYSEHILEAPTTTVLCRTSDPQFPQLCSKPWFSGLSATSDQCWHQHEIPSAADLFAIRRTCKLIHAETAGIYDSKTHNPLTSFSIQSRIGWPFFYHLTDAERGQVHRITMMDIPLGPASLPSPLNEYDPQIKAYTNLRTFAVQTPLLHWKFNVKRPKQKLVFDPEATWRDLAWMQIYERMWGVEVTIVFEAWVCVRPGHVLSEREEGDEMIVIRGVVWGTEKKKVEKSERKTSFEMKRIAVVENGEGAEWKKFWREKGLPYEQKGYTP